MGKIKHISLFNGIGGFQLAAHWAGWENVAHCEIDEWCNKVVAQHFPNSKCYTDIKQFNANEYRNSINVISGGFPCQPFSLAGKQRGKDDDRYLWPEMLRVIREVKPQIVIGENVAGIVDLALDTVLSDLEGEGYKTEAFIIPACAINAPHRRDRVWIIAYTDNWWNGWWKQQQESQQETVEPNENTNGFRCNGKEWESKSEIRGFGEFGTGNNERIYSEQIITDTESTRQQMCKNRQRKEQLRGSATRDIWQEWTTEPPICGMDNGIPDRVDRIKALGNAIVPQVAYEIMNFLNLIAAKAAKERGAVFNNFQTELSNENEM